ncbi:LptF/LptG family permease [Phenylobacterium sp.]|uniref:LptF/LptG family permease n=1 Tax=Phenylobacterium sp. TaxID=1871053 RepID=UPI003783F2AA
MRIIDKYALKLMLWPLLGSMLVTLVGLLLERVLRLLDMLSSSSNRFGFLTELTANLVPHYLGLTLPAAFFISLFVVISRLNQDSEIDALLASGVSFSRIVAPYLGLGVVLMCISLVLFGYVQPYSRYGYRAVLFAAENAGWSGSIQGGMIVSPNDRLVMTANSADAAGRRLGGVFIRQVDDDGRHQVITARLGQLRTNADRESATLTLENGLQLGENSRGEPEVLSFDTFSLRVPLSGASRLLRARGGDERELTLGELLREAGEPQSIVPRQTLIAEFLARLSRALSLPLLPLLALPLGLAAKRRGAAPGMIVAGLLLLAFNQLLQFGQGLAAGGGAPAILAVGAPFLAFAAICIATFVTSRKRPGETPVGLLVEYVADALYRAHKKLKLRRKVVA